MTLLVVDASVVIEWYVPEAGTQAAAALLENGDTLYAPDLLLPEAGNILWKKVKLGELTPAEGREILHAINQAPFTNAKAQEESQIIGYSNTEDIFASSRLCVAQLGTLHMARLRLLR